MKSRLISGLSGIVLLICLFGFEVQAQNTSLPVGVVPGSADVTAMGAATYNIPIEVVPGTHGVQPNLNVVYNSMIGTGILGSQWDLSGISAITRVGQNTFLDLRCSSVALNYSDRFALDGNRLVSSDPTLYGESGNLYQPEFEDYSKIYSYGVAGNGPSYFLVYREDGSKAEYGNSADSKQRLGNSVYSWYINKITDINGNYMTFTYGYSGSEIWIDHIDYTGNTAAGLEPYARVSFEYATFTHIGSTFVAGYEIPQTKLLQAITVQYKNESGYEMVRQYRFSYTDEYPKRLVEIGLKGSDESALNPTEMEWNTLHYGTPSTSTFSVPTMVFNETNFHFALDFNGDGLSDIVEYNRSKRRVLVNHNNTFQEVFSDEQPHTNPHIESAVAADINGDGYSEVITAYFDENDRELEITALTQSLDEVTLLQLSGVNSVKAVLAGDFCNNGSHQLLICYNGNKVILYNGPHSHAELTLDHSNGKIDLLNFDGDGQTEFVLIKNNTLNVYKYNLETMQIECVGNAIPFSGEQIVFEDINNDGISDCYYWANSNHYAVALGNGRGFFEDIPLSFQMPPTVYPPILVDINNDGYGDFLTFHQASQYTGVSLFVYLGQGYYDDKLQFYHDGGAWSFYPFILPPSGNDNPGSENIIIGNFNTDNRLDFIVAWLRNGNDQLVLYEFNESKTCPQVTELTHGDGSFVQWQYQTVQGYFYRYSTNIKSFPYYFDVVKTMRTSGDQPNRKFAYHYLFEKPQYSFSRHSVMGFSTITRKDSVMNITDTTHFANITSNYTLQDVLMPVRKITKMGYSNLASESYTPVIQYLASNRRKPYFSYRSSSDFLTNTMVVQRNTVSSEGRTIASSTSTKDINENGYLTKDSVLYYYSTANLSNGAFMTRADSTVSYSYSGNSSTFFTKKHVYSYQSDGKLQSSSVLCDGITNTVTNNTFDAFGNVKKQTVSATGCDSRETNRLYDATGRFCVTEFNAMNHVTSVINDPYTGLPLSTIDQNILTTTYRYDAFGKLISIHYPDGNRDTITYAWYTDTEIPNAKYYKRTAVSGNSYPIEEYYDLLGRIICTRENGYYSDTRYTSKGFVEKVSKPYSHGTEDEDKIWHTWQYDNFGRATWEWDAYLNVEYIYQGRNTTVWDHLRNTLTTRIQDAAGRISSISGEGGQIQYSYTPTMLEGKTVLNTTVTANGNTTTIVTDQRGNRIKIQDPDAGTTTYSYNAYGEMVRQVNAKGDTLKKSYDVLGRVSRNQYSDNLGFTRDIRYYYDYQNNNNKGMGKLYLVTVNGTPAESYSYDQLSRLAQHTRSIDGTDYTESYSYNTYGQLASLIYPDGFATDFTYTGKGYLSEITRHDNNKNVFKAYTYNIYGQPTKCGYGNSTATEYDYNPVGLLTRIKTGWKNYGLTPHPHDTIIFSSHLADINGMNEVNGLTDLINPAEQPFTVDSTIQSFRYSYDNKGRLSKRMQMGNRYETFQYDNLDRLTSFTQVKVNGPSQSFTTVYDLQGNIQSNTLAGTYSYDSGKPHAVTRVTPNDTFPNSISTEDCETDYNVFNQPSRIAEGDVEILLEYGADNQRVKAVFKRSGQVERTRYYINANYEKEVDANGVTTHYNYIYGATGLAAICVRRNGVDSMYYVHPDRLGSYTHITDSNRRVIRNLHFDPWGNVKSDTNWTVFEGREPGELTSTFRFDRGFTGHEHYADLNIINMNGRLYDPVIARFFSPDNFVQAPEFTQSYNRYSYCLNNPLQYTDPSGMAMEWWQQLLVGLGVDLMTGGAISVTAITLGSTMAVGSSDIGYELQKLVSPIAFKFSYGFGSRNHIGFDASLGFGGVLDYRWHGGISYYFGTNAYGKYNGWEYRDGAEIRMYGVGEISGTRYTSGEYSQTTNKITLGDAFTNASYENDQLFGVGKVLGMYNADGGDRWRSAAVQFKFGIISANLNLFTGDPGLSRADRNVGLEDLGNGHYAYTQLGANNAEQRAGVLSFSIGFIRFGRNSEMIRHIFQNSFAHDKLTGGANKAYWFKVLDIAPSWFWYFGTGNGDTLW